MLLVKRFKNTFMFCSFSRNDFSRFSWAQRMLRSKISTIEIFIFTRSDGREVPCRPEIPKSDVRISLKPFFYFLRCRNLQIFDYKNLGKVWLSIRIYFLLVLWNLFCSFFCQLTDFIVLIKIFFGAEPSSISNIILRDPFFKNALYKTANIYNLHIFFICIFV